MHKQLLHDQGKICPSCMNPENPEIGKFTTRKMIVLKVFRILDFHSEYYIPEIEKLDFHLQHVYILGKNNCAGKRHDMFVSRHNILNTNGNMIMQKAVR